MYLSLWLFAIVILILLSKITWFFVRFNRRKQRLLEYVKHLPSPNEFPVIGSGLRFFGKTTEGKVFDGKF